jgi:threonine dehydrogenase-like Zn-dependent dehydrogenase
VRALVVERSLARFAAARAASALGTSPAPAPVRPLRLVDADPVELPGPGWYRLRPRLSGICGSDLATLEGRSSRYFEPLVSFPFVPGHEVVAELDDDGPPPPSGSPLRPGARVVLEPVLGCAARGIDPPCPACADRDVGGCERTAFGHLRPGLQTGYCADTGGGWSEAFVAHETQLHPVPEAMTDEAAVMVEPTACAVHAALAAGVEDGATVVVLGAGTLGLCTLAALASLARPGTLVAAAKHPVQRRLAAELGADVVVEPDALRRSVRRLTRSLSAGRHLTAGADAVVDCVGSRRSLEEALEVVRPRGRVVLVGMPAASRVDLAPLWHREVTLVGAYTYGRERLPGRPRTFDLAFDVVARAGLERLVSARYALEDHDAAVAHAAGAGRRGAVKVVFDPRWRPRHRENRRERRTA